MNTTIAVTGASGHIGNVVCRILIEKGYKVKALYNSDKKSLEGLPVEAIQGSVLNKTDIARLMEGCDVVIHCAALISIHGDPKGIVFKTNTEGPANVLEVSKQKGIKKIIHISSVHAVMEIPASLPFDETRPYKTSSAFAYDYSKATGEQLMLANAKNGNPEIVVLRLSGVIGPFDYKPSEMGKALIDFYHQRVPALPHGGYNFVDVRDVATSIVEAIEKGKDGEVYLISGKYFTFKELAQIVYKVTGKKMPKIVIPYTLLKLSLPLISLYGKIKGAAPLFTIESIDALKNGHRNMNHSKAMHQLGHHSRPMEETIRDFYSWQRSNNMLQ
jgi:dihydroflavonol-4-reductase